MDFQINVARNPDLVAADMDGDKVMLDIDTGKYFALNQVGAHVWDLLEQPRSLASVLDGVRDVFDVQGSDLLEADLEAFFTDLLENGLIKEVAD